MRQIMKHVTLFLFCFGFLCPLVYGSLVIQEIYPNPVNTETGGEAVLIKNTGTSPLDISNLILKSQTTNQDAVIPDQTILQPVHFFLLP